MVVPSHQEREASGVQEPGEPHRRAESRREAWLEDTEVLSATAE